MGVNVDGKSKPSLRWILRLSHVGEPEVRFVRAEETLLAEEAALLARLTTIRIQLAETRMQATIATGRRTQEEIAAAKLAEKEAHATGDR
jgi:hypothetical protein